MKRFTKTLVAICAIVVLSTIFVGCQSFKYGPIGTTDSNAEVINNGTLVVQQGKYLYYVNGMDDTTTITEPKINYFGKASIKGSIMKSTINDDGTLSDTQVVVPKMFYTNYAQGGLYIFGDWIYYVSPSTKTNNEGKVQVDYLEYMRTKTDGTKTQTIALVSGNSNQYYYTNNSLVYYSSNTLHKVSFDDKKVGKTQTIAESIEEILFTKGSTTIFYTKKLDSESEAGKKYRNNQLYVISNTIEEKLLVDTNTFGTADKEPTLKEQKTIAPIKFDQTENVLYFSSTDNDDAGEVGTFGIKFGEDFGFNKDNIVKLANSKISSFVPLGLDNGILNVTDSKIKTLKPITSSDLMDKVENEIELSSAPTVLFMDNTANNKYLYYSINSKVYRLDINAENPVEEQIFDKTISTSWLGMTKLGNYIYFINSNNYNYLYRFDYTQYQLNDNERTFPTAVIVSGYVESEKTENGLLPKFMTDTDQKSYISANPAKEK